MSPVVDQPDPDLVATAVSTCSSVAGLSGGAVGEVATYLPGRRVSGVRVRPGEVEVHVVARYGSSLSTIDAEVRSALASAVPSSVTVDVVLADVEDPFAPPKPEPEPEPSTGSAPESTPTVTRKTSPSASSTPAPATPTVTVPPRVPPLPPSSAGVDPGPVAPPVPPIGPLSGVRPAPLATPPEIPRATRPTGPPPPSAGAGPRP